MHKDIQGVKIAADPALPPEKVYELTVDIIRTWQWEGRRLGRIELHMNGPIIRAFAFEKPFQLTIPAITSSEGIMSCTNKEVVKSCFQ